MAGNYSQDNRLLTLTTPIGNGTDVLLITELTVTEEISRLFVLDVRAIAELSKAEAVSGDTLLGQTATVSIELPGGLRRHLNGVIRRFAEAEADGECRYYYLQIVPWLWYLTLTSSCRIFQDLTAPDIAFRIFDDRKLGSYRRGALRSDYTVRDYTTQYRETDFNFVTRLMEDEGVYYFFEQTGSASEGSANHTLVVTDLFIGSASCPNQPSASFAPDASFGERADRITSWQVKRSLLPGRTRLRDYHFEMSARILEVDEFGLGQGDATADLQVFDYPGGFAEKANRIGRNLNAVLEDGQRTARMRMEEIDAPYSTFTGLSFCRDFAAGYGFKLSDHSTRMDGDYVITSVTHSAFQNPPYRSGDEARIPYHNSFSCLPLDTSFRPGRTTSRPVVQGLQTATVTAHDNKKETEISCDKYGRVLVLFHWDLRYDSSRNDTSTEPSKTSSAWIRVAQVWAGKGFGALFLPRVGNEVLVGFLEGDPDQPIIVGSLYNNTHMPPYTLPANQTQSGIKTHSSQGGSASQFNELRFEDAAGKEEVTLHAERALTVGVEGSESRSIGGTRRTTISNAGKSPAPVADQLTIKQGDRKTTLTKGNDVVVVTMGDHTYTITQGGETHTITAGDFKIAALAGTAKIEAKTIEISGLVQVKISCGASSITLTPASVEIKGPMVMIN